MGVTVSIPQVEGKLAGNYTWNGGYGADGSLSGEAFAAVGGLNRETVNYVLDDWGRLLSSSGAYNGTVELVTDMLYTKYGEPERLQLGDSGARTWLSYYYDDHTRRLTRSINDRATTGLPTLRISGPHLVTDLDILDRLRRGGPGGTARPCDTRPWSRVDPQGAFELRRPHDLPAESCCDIHSRMCLAPGPPFDVAEYHFPLHTAISPPGMQVTRLPSGPTSPHAS